MDNLNSQASRSVSILFVRQVIVQIITLSGGIILARTLTPVEFGVFGIATFLINTSSLMGDLGIGAALIQRKEPLSNHDIRVGFTFQMILSLFVVTILWVAAPDIASFYPDAPDGLEWLVRAMAFSLFFIAWRSTSALRLERDLLYGAISFVDIVEQLIFIGIAIPMALYGYGVWALVIAVLTRTGVGALFLYIYRPWSMMPAWNLELVKEVARFGIPYQAQHILNSSQAWVTPTVIATTLGTETVGYILWAVALGHKPIVFLIPMMRVVFTHVSRIQDKLEDVGKVVLRYVGFLLSISALWAVVLVVTGEDAIRFVYTDKWQTAIPLVIIYSLYFGLISLNSVAATTLNGLGRIQFSTYAIGARSALTIILTLALVDHIGMMAVPVGEILALCVIIPIQLSKVTKNYLGQVLLDSSWLLIPITVASIAGTFSAGYFLDIGWGSLVPPMITGLAFVISAYFGAPARVINDIQQLIRRDKQI